MIEGILNSSEKEIDLNSFKIQPKEFISIEDINSKKNEFTKGLIINNYNSLGIIIVDKNLNKLEDVLISKEEIIIKGKSFFRERKYDKLLFDFNKLV